VAAGSVDRAISTLYFRWAYRPKVLAGRGQDVATEQHLQTVPWYCEAKPVCQSVALQMIAAHHGVHAARAHIDFLMGFTYGAGFTPAWGFLTVGRDPETGLAAAAPFLGLTVRYRVTDDPQRFLAALRAEVASGHPVRVPLDMAALYGQGQPVPHNEVVVGYDGAGFWYYEPTALPPAGCAPGDRPAGTTGLPVGEERLLAAVRSQSELFGYPWRYAMACFEPGRTRTDLTPVWRTNGRLLAGGSRWGQRWGAAAIEHAAALLEADRAELDLVERGVVLAAATRPDNAAYLREAHPDDPRVAQAADGFERAAAAYRDAEALIGAHPRPTDAKRGVASQLRLAAAAERDAGRCLLDHARARAPRQAAHAGRPGRRSAA